jgi:hypothetical protein
MVVVLSSEYEKRYGCRGNCVGGVGGGLKPAPASVFILYGRGMRRRVCGIQEPGATDFA